MSKLQHFKMGTLLKIKHGFPFLGEFFSSAGQYVVLTPGNFFETGGFKRILGKEKYYTASIPNEYMCKKSDLIVAMTEQAEGLLGSTAFIPESNMYLHNQRIGLITEDSTKVNRQFLYYLFMTKAVRKQIRDTASGTKVKHTSPERIYDVDVHIPELSAQIKSANLLWNIDQKIALNNCIIAELEAMAKKFYDYWFVQFDFPNAEGKPYRQSGGEMVYNETLKREIPKGWTVKYVKDILNVVTGKEDANFSTKNGKYKFFTCSQEPLSCDTPVFSGNAVLIAGNGDFNVKHYTGAFNAYQRTYVLIPEVKYYHLLYIAANNRIVNFKSGSNGSIVKFITKSDIESITIICPEDEHLLNVLNKYLFLQEQRERENLELIHLRDWLLPMLMNGQATVE